MVAAPALFAECDVVIVRRHRRWAWGSREGKQEEEGEVVEWKLKQSKRRPRWGGSAARRAVQSRWNPELRRLRLKTAGVAGPPPSPER